MIIVEMNGYRGENFSFVFIVVIKISILQIKRHHGLYLHGHEVAVSLRLYHEVKVQYFFYLYTEVTLSAGLFF